MAKSILQDDPTRCYLCNGIATETHHILGGIANRKLSEKYGLTVRLCHNCHTGTDGAQYDRGKNIQLRQDAQFAFENLHGHRMWMATFGRNYI